MADYIRRSGVQVLHILKTSSNFSLTRSPVRCEIDNYENVYK